MGISLSGSYRPVKSSRLVCWVDDRYKITAFPPFPLVSYRPIRASGCPELVGLIHNDGQIPFLFTAAVAGRVCHKDFPAARHTAQDNEMPAVCKMVE